jgi:hypothetical protein
MPGRPLEELFGPHFRGPPLTQLTTLGAWAGRTSLGSAQASVTVSTAVVNSDSVFMIASNPGSVGVGANSGGAVVVNSIVSGVSFALARATAVGAPWDSTVSWMIWRTS